MLKRPSPLIEAQKEVKIFLQNISYILHYITHYFISMLCLVFIKFLKYELIFLTFLQVQFWNLKRGAGHASWSAHFAQ